MVCRRAGWLNQIDILAADILIDLNKCLAVRKRCDLDISQLVTKMSCDFFASSLCALPLNIFMELQFLCVVCITLVATARRGEDKWYLPVAIEG